MQYRFGPFVADRTAYRLLEGDRILDPTPKLLDVLFYLVERPGVLVTKEELLDGVWPGANVTDNALAQAVSELRDILGDEPASPTYIRTVARRGYRFIAPVVRAEATTTAGSRPASAPASQPSAEPTPPAIAVVDFANVTGDPSVAWLAAGIAETVTSDLTDVGQWRVIDRWRVVASARRPDVSMHEIASDIGAALIVTGSYQRSGSSLRLTARLIDITRGEVLADVKVDGELADVFALQDRIVSGFARELGLAAQVSPPRETSSLDAFRAYTEGWLKIESLDTSRVKDAIADFQKAIRADSSYAMAYTGLANANFVVYEMSRSAAKADQGALDAGIEHARRAIRLNDRLAEAHATLSFLLSSAQQFDDARAAAQRAVALEPESWRHHYRLGHAQWGTARLRSLERALRLYPGFAYATFESAMVFVARGDLDAAERLVREGVAGQDRQARTGHRYPAVGLHWLQGAIALSDGRVEAACESFDREVGQADPTRLYAPEYATLALVARGHAELLQDKLQRALKSFRQAQQHLPGHVRASIGEAAALARLGRTAESTEAWRQAETAERALADSNRPYDALLASACAAAMRGEAEAAVAGLIKLLDVAPPASPVGWTVPIEPALACLRGRPDFGEVLERLAGRAR